jgi:predicted acetyltransferase
VDLLLRPLRVEDEPQFVAACHELAAEGFEFGMQWAAEMEFSSFVAELHDEEVGVVAHPGYVPATFRVAVVSDDLVGRVSIRHSLNPRLASVGGHIGYAVRPAFRRRGFATEILRQSLSIAAGLGIDPALVTCDEDNEGSREVILRCAGVPDGTAVDERSGTTKLRFWCPTS